MNRAGGNKKFFLIIDENTLSFMRNLTDLFIKSFYFLLFANLCKDEFQENNFQRNFTKYL